MKKKRETKQVNNKLIIVFILGLSLFHGSSRKLKQYLVSFSYHPNNSHRKVLLEVPSTFTCICTLKISSIDTIQNFGSLVNVSVARFRSVSAQLTSSLLYRDLCK